MNKSTENNKINLNQLLNNNQFDNELLKQFRSVDINKLSINNFNYQTLTQKNIDLIDSKIDEDLINYLDNQINDAQNKLNKNEDLENKNKNLPNNSIPSNEHQRNQIYAEFYQKKITCLQFIQDNIQNISKKITEPEVIEVDDKEFYGNQNLVIQERHQNPKKIQIPKLNHEHSKINLENLLNDDYLVMRKELNKFNQQQNKSEIEIQIFNKDRLKNSDIMTIYLKKIEYEQEIKTLNSQQAYSKDEHQVSQYRIKAYQESIQIFEQILTKYQQFINEEFPKNSQFKFNLTNPSHVYILNNIPDDNIEPIKDDQDDHIEQDNSIEYDDDAFENHMSYQHVAQKSNEFNNLEISDEQLSTINKLEKLFKKYEKDPVINNIIVELQTSLKIPSNIKNQALKDFKPIKNCKDTYQRYQELLSKYESGFAFNKIIEAIFGDFFKNSQEKFVKKYKQIIEQDNNISENNNKLKL